MSAQAKRVSPILGGAGPNETTTTTSTWHPQCKFVGTSVLGCASSLDIVAGLLSIAL